MKRKQVWRYWCDHCRKGGCSGGHIAKHEKHCIYNPLRACRMCRVATGEQHGPNFVRANIDALNSGGIKALTEIAHGCPACILAAIVQRRREMGDKYNPEEDYITFDYKAACEQVWADFNAERSQLA